MTEWRDTPTGARQWLGADGNWYSSERLAQAAVPRTAPQFTARPLSPEPTPPQQLSLLGRMLFGMLHHWRLTLFGLIVIIVLIVGAINGTASGPSAKYRASIVSVNDPTATPKTITVVFRVANHGNNAGAPSCLINSITTPHAHGSTTVAFTTPIDPGHSDMSSTSVRITTTGAGSITKTEVKISCT